jgi:4-hydroxybenzoate polyprenyltransferase
MEKSLLQGVAELIRLHRPVGIFLLLWPTWWALWLAAPGLPAFKLWLIFTAGVVIMRSAGCAINDIVDQRFDGKVQRTQQRPLVAGKLSKTTALITFASLCLIAFILVLFLNWQTIALAFVALALAIAYPFMKRYTYFPQVVLGAAWYVGILMAFTATNSALSLTAWLLYFASILWAMVYDTMYAMVDRDDDVKIGVKSTAILFGVYDKLIIGLLQFCVLTLLSWIGFINSLPMIYYISLCVAAGFFIYQQYLIKDRQRTRCLDAFTNNHWVGAVIFIGLFFSLPH